MTLALASQASMTVALASQADMQTPKSAPCEGSVYEDAMDIALMTGVFAIGWFLVKWLAKVGLFKRRARLPKIIDAEADEPSWAAKAFDLAAPIQDEAVQSSSAIKGFDFAAVTLQEEANPPSNDISLAEIARLHGSRGRGDLAVDMWCARAGEVAAADSFPEPELYGAALEACALSSDFASAERLVRQADWRAPPCRAGQAAMLALARFLARRQGTSSARRCATAVRKAGGCVDIVTLRALLAASARGGDMAQAKEFFDELPMNASAEREACAASLVHGYCAAGDVEQAVTCFRALRRESLKPQVALYNALLGACAGRSMSGLAEELMADMEAAGVQPTGDTLAALLRLYGARGNVARVVEVFAEFPRQHGLEPDARAYHALVAACLAGGRPELALEAFGKMTAAGCLASARTYEALIGSCCRRGDLVRATSLVEEAFGLAPLVTESQAQPEAPAAAQPSESQQRRAHLEPQVVEELLRLAGRRGEAARLGLPLIARLQEAGYEVSERVASGVRRAAAASRPAESLEAPAARLQASLQAQRAERQTEWSHWRNGFSRR